MIIIHRKCFTPVQVVDIGMGCLERWCPKCRTDLYRKDTVVVFTKIHLPEDMAWVKRDGIVEGRFRNPNPSTEI